MTESPTVLILDRDADDYERRLAKLATDGVRLIVAEDRLPDGAAEATVVLGAPDRVVASLSSLPRVRWIQSTWAGVTPLLPAAREGVLVTGIKDVFGTQMAEFVMACLLEHAIDLPTRRAAQQRGEWLDTPTGTLHGTTLGIMGTGSIGVDIARRASAFGMRVLGFSRSGKACPPFAEVRGADGLHAFLAECDYLVGVLPDTPATRNLLDAEALAALPAHAVLINVGRGTLIDDEALVAALDAGRLAGAVLDVFREEPLPASHPFWSCPSLTVTAHVAARSWPADIAAIFEDNLHRYRRGESLRFRLDPERGY